jgi:hypothetical protein
MFLDEDMTMDNAQQHNICTILVHFFYCCCVNVWKDICCFPGKVSCSFGTHDFSPSAISGTFAVFYSCGLLNLWLGGRTMQ